MKKVRVKRMNKKEAISELINTIYNNNSDLILSESDIKRLNNFFKEVVQVRFYIVKFIYCICIIFFRK